MTDIDTETSTESYEEAEPIEFNVELNIETDDNLYELPLYCIELPPFYMSNFWLGSILDAALAEHGVDKHKSVVANASHCYLLFQASDRTTVFDIPQAEHEEIEDEEIEHSGIASIDFETIDSSERFNELPPTMQDSWPGAFLLYQNLLQAGFESWRQLHDLVVHMNILVRLFYFKLGLQLLPVQRVLELMDKRHVDAARLLFDTDVYGLTCRFRDRWRKFEASRCSDGDKKTKQ